MAISWTQQDRKRPDPYLDWELRNRPHDGSQERWSPVLLHVTPGTAAAPAKNLKRLQTAATKGKTDPDTGVFLRVVMNGDEQKRLTKTIQDLESGTSAVPGSTDVSWDFFVYVHEDDIYKEGQYAHRPEFFTILFAGPPILESLASKATELPPTELPPLSKPPLTRRPVAIGVIDDGLAFANERFCGVGEDGRPLTRFAAIWLQDIERIDPHSNMVFGKVLDAGQINQWLDKASSCNHIVDDGEVYRSSKRWDFSRDRREQTEFRLAHGTHVMDLACGFDPRDEGEQHDARHFPILAVQLPDAVTADTSGVSMGSYVLQALRQIMLWADRLRESDKPDSYLPLVVNFSYGITAGPKDGSHDLEEQIRRLVADRNSRAPTAVVLPAGNAYRDRTAAKMALQPDIAQQIDWMILPDDGTPSFVEIWFNLDHAPDARCPITVLVAPPLCPASPDTRPALGEVQLLHGDKPVCAIYYDCMTPPPHAVPDVGDGGELRRRARIFLAVNPSKTWEEHVPVAPSGRWTITLTNKSTAPIDVRLYVQRDDTPGAFRSKGRQSFFDHPNAFERDPVTGDYNALCKEGPITYEGTLSAIGTGQATVIVGAARDGELLQPADYTSSGPTPGRHGPDLSAIAEDGVAFPGILAAGSASGSVLAMGGTSVAAPQVTRALARNVGLLAGLEGLYSRSGELDEQNNAEDCAQPAATGTMDARRLGRLVLQPREPASGQRRKWPQRT